MEKIIHFFTEHDPFTSSSSDGLTDSDNKVTAENADIIGRIIQEILTNILKIKLC